jgi:hypothetical protein
MQVLPTAMISELLLSELSTYGKLTLQSIGELLGVQGYEDMTSKMLVEEIECIAEDYPGVKRAGDLFCILNY